jgi:DNA-binding NtrC family response regulator
MEHRLNRHGTGETVSDLHEQDPAALFCANDVNLLIIDDDEDICRLIKTALVGHDFQVESVSDPQEIEPRLKTKTYHLIILDYMIPPLQAEQVMEWLKNHQAEASVIVVTGYPSIDNALYYLRARTYDYITKPFQVAHLQRVVLRCLESKGLLRLSEDALREALGTAIRERRKSMGLTLAQMAAKTKVSLGYLSQIELGKNSASIETLYRISLGLGVRMADLFQTVQPAP